MNAAKPPSWRPLVAAFVIWFAHFMGCWVAAEIWPAQWQANVLAWVLTALAIGALAFEWTRRELRPPDGDLARWNRRMKRGAIAIAGAAVLFGAVPSLVFLPTERQNAIRTPSVNCEKRAPKRRAVPEL